MFNVTKYEGIEIKPSHPSCGILNCFLTSRHECCVALRQGYESNVAHAHRGLARGPTVLQVATPRDPPCCMWLSLISP